MWLDRQPGPVADVNIRSRRHGDVAACVEILRRVHQIDGYPTHWPQDPVRFVAPPYELEAWVAEEPGGEVRGHVALHDAGQDPACHRAQSASDLGPDNLAAVGRLFIAPGFRRRGVGVELLHAATTAAHRRRQRPFLNVVQTLDAAIAMYDRGRWENVGPLRIHFGDGNVLDTVVYLGPAPSAVDT